MECADCERAGASGCLDDAGDGYDLDGASVSLGKQYLQWSPAYDGPMCGAAIRLAHCA